MIESIIPCIKVTQTNGMIGCDRYIEEGENIKFITEDNKTIEGTFLFIELSQYEECDDIIHVESNTGERLAFGTSKIKEFID